MRPMGRWSNPRVRGALIAIVVSGGLALTGCASIDELKDAISRLLDTGSLGEPEASPEDLPRAISMTSPQNPKAETNAVSKGGTSRRATSGRLRPQGNLRTLFPSRRPSRKARKRNPRLRHPCDCTLCIPRRPHPEFLHAEIGHRTTGSD